jgi:hypothetical protein
MEQSVSITKPGLPATASVIDSKQLNKLSGNDIDNLVDVVLKKTTTVTTNSDSLIYFLNYS